MIIIVQKSCLIRTFPKLVKPEFAPLVGTKPEVFLYIVLLELTKIYRRFLKVGIHFSTGIYAK